MTGVQTCALPISYQTEPTSAFGGIIAFNRELDETTAQEIVNRQFVEVIIAPSATDAAVAVISSKPNVRLLVCGEFSAAAPTVDIKHYQQYLL